MARPASPPVETSDRKASKKRKHSSLAEADKELEIDVSLPEPPSKKDLRRLKKLKSKGVDTDTLTSLNVPLIDRSKKGAQEGETPAGTSASASKHSPYGVWIGNLSFSTTRDDLLNFLTRRPKDGVDGNEKSADDAAAGLRAKDVTRINLPKSTRFKGQNKGFAYVDFLTAGCISHALALSETLFNGRKVLIKASTDFNGRPDETQSTKAADKSSINAGSNPPCRSVFVGNLGYEVKEEEVFRHLSPAGKIKKVRFMTFEDSGKCKGFCWVDFEDLKSAENVFAGRIEGAEDSESESESDSEENKADEAGEDDEAPSEKPDKARKKKQKKQKSNPYAFMGGRKLRLEYGEDPTTRYKKRFGDGKPEDATGGANSGSSRGKRSDGDRPGRRNDATAPKKELTPGEKLAKSVESRLTGRIVESTGKKITFD
ncbi:hypothetical protein DRE_00227 [Drechslerella stenobrocha 248]|uniref:RRM domain-containing protein n=1 Tax=Drechslerella stenobrocha 248 TaxID=1043628 RepID=W7I9Y0_9PEZI|nr:hypothetical protein DRE_00227 [Drechslerella stenobrocha 248]